MVFNGGIHSICKRITSQSGEINARINHEKCPACHEHQQCDSSLVDFRDTFKGNKHVANYKYHDN